MMVSFQLHARKSGNLLKLTQLRLQQFILASSQSNHSERKATLMSWNNNGIWADRPPRW